MEDSTSWYESCWRQNLPNNHLIFGMQYPHHYIISLQWLPHCHGMKARILTMATLSAPYMSLNQSNVPFPLCSLPSRHSRLLSGLCTWPSSSHLRTFSDGSPLAWNTLNSSSMYHNNSYISSPTATDVFPDFTQQVKHAILPLYTLIVTQSYP